MDVGTPHRFSVHDYHRMAEAGVLAHDARVELIRGAIIDMPAIGTPHLWTVNNLTMLLAPLVAGRAIVSVQNSIRLDDHSEPEPDIALIAATADRTRHPGPADILLVIEVADTTLAFDRAVKASLYAESALPEFWLADLPNRTIERHRDPAGGTYRTVDRLTTGTLPLPGLPGLTVALDAFFPPG